MANAWRPMVEETQGGWRYRWAAGVSRRANSALARDGSGSLPELVDHAESFYGKRDAPSRIHVSTASAPRTLAAVLRERGYQSSARTLVLRATTSDVVDRARSGPEIAIADEPSDQWCHAYWSRDPGRIPSDGHTAVYRDFLLDPGLPTVFATAREGSEVLGVGQLVIERGWGGVQCMATVSSRRRRGVARGVLGGLAVEAADRGVGQLYLAVMADNVAAMALYSSAGFRAVHEYCYFTLQRD